MDELEGVEEAVGLSSETPPYRDEAAKGWGTQVT